MAKKATERKISYEVIEGDIVKMIHKDWKKKRTFIGEKASVPWIKAEFPHLSANNTIMLEVTKTQKEADVLKAVKEFVAKKK